MITKLSHASFFVDDQDKAFDFYINKLGFNVNTDVKMENGFRWLTVNPPDQPDLEIILFPVDATNGFDEETNAALKLLLKKRSNGCRCILHGRLPGYLRRVKSKRSGF